MSVKASLKKIYLKKLKFLLLAGEIVENVNEPIRKQQIKNFKICNFFVQLPCKGQKFAPFRSISNRF